jgi:hypothetical protein
LQNILRNVKWDNFQEQFIQNRFLKIVLEQFKNKSRTFVQEQFMYIFLHSSRTWFWNCSYMVLKVLKNSFMNISRTVINETIFKNSHSRPVLNNCSRTVQEQCSKTVLITFLKCSRTFLEHIQKYLFTNSSIINIEKISTRTKFITVH